MSAWTRTIVVPLSIMSALQAGAAARARSGGSPSCSASDLPRRPPRRTALVSLDELLPGRRPGPEVARPPGARRPGGSRRIRAAHRWMLDHFENSDGLGAIFPPMIYTVIALRVPGLRRRFARGAVGAGSSSTTS